jgi:hypothetical protein
MLRGSPIFMVMALALGAGAVGSGAMAQPTAQGRDCQTILKCQYKKGSSWRGCISSYSCRTCNTVPARSIRGKRTYAFACGWGA